MILYQKTFLRIYCLQIKILIANIIPAREVIVAKFMDQFDSYGKLPASHAEKIIDMAGHIEDIEDMREFMELL